MDQSDERSTDPKDSSPRATYSEASSRRRLASWQWGTPSSDTTIEEEIEPLSPAINPQSGTNNDKERRSSHARTVQKTLRRFPTEG